jgi:hypothetical protein
MSDERLRHRAYTRAVGDDPPGVADWTWPADRDRGREPARGTPA